VKKNISDLYQGVADSGQGIGGLMKPVGPRQGASVLGSKAEHIFRNREMIENMADAGNLIVGGRRLNRSQAQAMLDQMRDLQLPQRYGTTPRTLFNAGGQGRTLGDMYKQTGARWYDKAGLGLGAGAGLYGMFSGGEEEAAPEPAPEEEGNFLTRTMSGIGDWTGENISPGMGEWIKKNPYMSAGIGGGGIALLIYLLMKLMGGRGR
jgi:hypothetical protein